MNIGGTCQLHGGVIPHYLSGLRSEKINKILGLKKVLFYFTVKLRLGYKQAKKTTFKRI